MQVIELAAVRRGKLMTSTDTAFVFDLSRINDLLSKDPELTLLSRFVELRLRLRVTDGHGEAVLLRFRDDRFVNAVATTSLDGCDLEIGATTEQWGKLLQAEPEPFYQAIFSAAVREGLQVAGDMEIFHAYQPVIARVHQLLRAGVREEDVLPADRAHGAWDDAVGRYLHLTVEGTTFRVYVETAGRGIPLLVQHTAGADSRQWRHVLEDAEITDRFQVIAWDLPFHGKSLPPQSVRWWTEKYTLTKSFFTDFVLALSETMQLDAPVFLGVSMGGLLATDLALDHPDRFRAIIACEVTHENHGLDDPLFHHPRIAADARAAAMYGVMGPHGPEPHKRESAWVYASNGPGVMLGDLHYNCVEHDLTEDASRIDAAATPIYLANGQFDFGMTPQQGRALADDIDGCHFAVIEALGHFPMSENYPVFREYLLPILKEIESLHG